MSPWSELNCLGRGVHGLSKTSGAKGWTECGYSAFVTRAVNAGFSMLVGMMLPANGVLAVRSKNRTSRALMFRRFRPRRGCRAAVFRALKFATDFSRSEDVYRAGVS